MEGGKADLVITDPPYNAVIDGHATGNGSTHREFAMASGEMSSTEFTEFLRRAMIAAREHSTADSLAYYYFMDWRCLHALCSYITSLNGNQPKLGEERTLSSINVLPLDPKF